MILLAWIATGLLTPAAFGIQIRGDASCPTAAAVEEALLGLLPSGAPGPSGSDVVDLVVQGKAVNVRLFNPAKELIAEKRLPEALPCAERARTAAVMVAAWEVRLRGVTGPLGPLPATAPIAIAANNAAPGAAVPPPGVPAATISRGLPASATGGPAPAGIHLDVSAAGLMSIAPASVAPAVTVAVSLRRDDSPRTVGLGALAVGTHSTEVASGRGAWRRIGGWVDLRSIARWPAVEAQLRAGLALTALSVRGEAFPLTRSVLLFDPGVLAGASIGLFPGRRVSPTLELTAAAWPRAHTLHVDGSPLSTQLPSFEALLGLGLALRSPR